MILPTAVASLVVALMLATRGQAQLPPTGVGPTGGTGGAVTPTAGPCATEYDASLSPQCIQPAGIVFANLLYLVSNTTAGSAPQGKTLEQFQSEICSDATQDVIVPCVLRLTMRYMNDTRCTENDRTLIDSSSRRLLMLMEQRCNDACLMVGMQGMVQCFISAQVDPARMINSSLVQDMFPLLGSSPQEVQSYCSAAPQMYSCLKQVRSTCQATQDQLIQMGIDLDAMETSTTLLCGRRTEYQAALQCFNSPNQGVATCRQQTASTVNSVIRGRYFSGEVVPSQVVPSMCRARMVQVNCELQSYGQSCAQHVGLRTAFECSVTPSACKTVDNYQSALGSKCQTVTLPPTVQPPVVPAQPSGGNMAPPGISNQNVATQSGSANNLWPRNPGNAASAQNRLSPWSSGLLVAAAALLHSLRLA